MSQTDEFKPLNLSSSKPENTSGVQEMNPASLVTFFSSKAFSVFIAFLGVLFLLLLGIRVYSIIIDFQFSLGEERAFEDFVNVVLLLVFSIIGLTNLQSLKSKSIEGQFDKESYTSLTSFFKGISIVFLLIFVYYLIIFVLLLLISPPLILVALYILMIIGFLIKFVFWSKLSTYMKNMLSFSKISSEIMPNSSGLNRATYTIMIFSIGSALLLFVLSFFTDSRDQIVQLFLGGAVYILNFVLYMGLFRLIRKFSQTVKH